MTDLPPGWEWATLGDIAESVKNGIYVSRPGAAPDGVPILRINAVRPAELRLDEIRYSGKSIEKLQSESALLEPGDLLFTRYSGSQDYVGVCAITPDNVDPLTYPDKLIRVRIKEIEPKYVMFAFSSPSVRSVVESSLRTTAGQVGISGANLKAVRIPLAPLAEQRRIVAKVEEYFSHLTVGSALLRTVLVNIRLLRAAFLWEAVHGTPLLQAVHDTEIKTDSNMSIEGDSEPREGPWDIPSDWLWSSIGELCQVFVGTTPQRSIAANWSGNIPWVSSGEVAFNRISKTREKISATALGNRETRLHPPGTVLLAMIGEGKTRGQAAILDITAAHNQNCASIRVAETDMIPEFVYAVLEQRYEQTRKSASGGNQPALNGAAVRAIPLPVPPREYQKAVVNRLEECRAAEDQLRRAVSAGLHQTEVLRRIILHDAFAGLLVPQDPNDEPASVLLERVKGERATRSKPRRVGRNTKRTNPDQESLL